MNTILARLPDYIRNAGVAKAEAAIRELTDAANQLGIADVLTAKLVALWNAFHGGKEPPLVVYEQPVLDKPSRDPTRKPQRGRRCDLDRLASPEGRAALQDVLLGLQSQRQAALKLGVHPNAFGHAFHKLRQEKQASETSLMFPLKSP